MDKEKIISLENLNQYSEETSGKIKKKIAEHTDNGDIHVTTTDKSNWNGKVDSNQGTSNAGKLLGTNSSGDVVAIQGYGFEYDETTKMLKYGTDPTTNLNQGISLDDTLSKKGYAAEASAVGELKSDLDNKVYPLTEQFTIDSNLNGTINENKFLNQYTWSLESYDGWYCGVFDIDENTDYEIYFKSTGASSVCGIGIFDSTDTRLKSFFRGESCDYTSEPYKLKSPPNSAKLYVSSYGFIPKVSGKVIEDFKTPYNCNMDIALNSSIRNRLGYIDGGACVFTCDDGMTSDETYIFPLINEFNIPFTFGMWVNSPILSTKLNEIKNLISNKDCEVAQHYPEDCSGRTILQNYQRFINQKNMFNNIGINIFNMIYPYNAYDENFEKSCSALYDYACGCGGGYKNNSARTKCYELNRIWITSNTNYQDAIDKAISENGLVIFGVHSSELSNSEVMSSMRNAIQYAKTSGINITTLKGLNSL